MQNHRHAARLWLSGAIGAWRGVFGGEVASNTADKIAQLGIGIPRPSDFFTFYYLLTGFHAAHVVAGILVLGLIAWRDSLYNQENGVAFWHMVDLVWVLLFAVIYLLR